MEEIYEKIMREGYGLQLRHGTRTRTGLVCRTDRGLRELKKPRGSTDSLRLAFDVKKRLRENGFANISRCYPTLEGEPFYRQDGTLYILEDLLFGGHWRRTAHRSIPFKTCSGAPLKYVLFIPFS